MAAATILVVDDEPLILDMVSQMLRGRGYEVISASGAGQALEIVRTYPPPRIDLVLCDVMMPEMRGPELVCEIARILPQTAGMLMSGGAFEPVHPAMPLIQKPFSDQDLASMVEAVLARAEQAQADLKRQCQ
jgi:CheY-like chemotaxis protein